MKNLSTGTGLVALSAAILGSTIIMRFGPADQAAHAAPPMEAARAIVAASTASPQKAAVGASVVVGYWVGADTGRCTSGDDTNGGFVQTHVRLWSDGRAEIRRVVWDNANLWVPNHWECREELEFAPQIRSSQWFEIPNSSAAQACAPDVNGDRVVNGADLGAVLASWGPTPECTSFPNIPCPLTLSNPMR